METSFRAPAYNGELRPVWEKAEDNTVGSLTETERSIVVGSLLGDGSMRCKRNALLEVNHSIAQREYVDWKYRMLSSLVRTGPKARNGNGKRVAYRFTTLSLPALLPYYEAFYVGGRKIAPKVELSPLSLAVWFMDDGCKSRNSVYLNTQQFDMGSQARMLDALFELGIVGTLNRDKVYRRIRIAAVGMARLRNLVEPYMLNELRHKLPD